jgi:hypothetical protein
MSSELFMSVFLVVFLLLLRSQLGVGMYSPLPILRTGLRMTATPLLCQTPLLKLAYWPPTLAVIWALMLPQAPPSCASEV